MNKYEYHKCPTPLMLKDCSCVKYIFETICKLLLLFILVSYEKRRKKCL